MNQLNGNLSEWRMIFDKWMVHNGYDLDKTECMWAVLSFVQHLEWLDLHNRPGCQNQKEEENSECINQNNISAFG